MQAAQEKIYACIQTERQTDKTYGRANFITVTANSLCNSAHFATFMLNISLWLGALVCLAVLVAGIMVAGGRG